MAVTELLIAVASLVMSAALEHRLSSRGPRDMQDLLGLGIKPMSPELPEGFFTVLCMLFLPEKEHGQMF